MELKTYGWILYHSNVQSIIEKIISWIYLNERHHFINSSSSLYYLKHENATSIAEYWGYVKILEEIYVIHKITDNQVRILLHIVKCKTCTLFTK